MQNSERFALSRNTGLINLADDLDFRDQSVVITGAASGIGLATAKMLHQFGAYIVALDIQEDALRTLSETFNQERIKTIPFDLSETDPNAYKKLAADIIDTSPLGSIDAFIMSAGVVQLTGSKGIRGAQAWEFQKLNQINALSNVDIFREIADHLADDARIVMVSSPIVSRGDQIATGYAISKGLMEAVTKQMQVELKDTDATVTGFVPPPVQNFLRTDLKPKEPLHAHPHGEDIAELPARLASRSVRQDFHGQVIAMGYSALRESATTPSGHKYDYMPRGDHGGFVYKLATREIATGGGDHGQFLSMWETSSSRELQGLGDTPAMDETVALENVYKPPAHIAQHRAPEV